MEANQLNEIVKKLAERIFFIEKKTENGWEPYGVGTFQNFIEASHTDGIFRISAVGDGL